MAVVRDITQNSWRSPFGIALPFYGGEHRKLQRFKNLSRVAHWLVTRLGINFSSLKVVFINDVK